MPLDELGRPSLKYFTVIKQVTYWLKLLKHDKNRYTSKCVLEQINLANNNINCWGLRTKYILCSLGFGHAWFNQGVGDENIFLQSLKLRLHDIDRQNWSHNIQDLDRLRVYKIIKEGSYFEPYAMILNDYFDRRIIARLRCGAMKLNVHLGRYNNVPYHERICDFCNTKEIDDEYHILLICPFHSDIRTKYIPYYYSNKPNLQKFINLISTDAKRTLFLVVNFIKHAIRARIDV